MGKVLTILGMVIALLVFVVFALDLAIGTPFEKANIGMDVGFVICAGILGFLSWSAYREQT